MSVLVRALPLLVLLHLAYSKESYNEIFSNFLTKQVKNYGSWVKQENEDPSQLLGNDRLSLSTKPDLEKSVMILSCNITDHYVKEHSQTETDIVAVQGYLDGPSIRIRRSTDATHPLRFGGSYELQGIVIAKTGKGNLTFTGSGNWTMTTNHTDETSFYGSFFIAPDGFINLQWAIRTFVYQATWSQFQIQGLSENATKYVENIKVELQRLYSASLLQYPDSNPSLRLFRRYFEGVLKNTSVTEIVGDLFDPTSLSPMASTDPSSSSSVKFKCNWIFILSVGFALIKY